MQCLYCDSSITEDNSKALGEYGLVLCFDCADLPEFNTRNNKEYMETTTIEKNTDVMKKELGMADILSQYIKHKNGAIFQMVSHKTPALVWLRSRNKYKAYSRKTLNQGVQDGEWKTINEHEWRKWVKTDNEYIEGMTHRLLKRVILAQLLIELDDELIADGEDIPQFRKLLERTNKESERIAVKNYDRLYSVDKTILQNVMKSIDSLTAKMASCQIEDFFHLDNVVQAYIDKREDFREVPITLQNVE